jgi:hypothetical protein
MKVEIQKTTETPKVKRGRPRESEKYKYHTLKIGEECSIKCDSKEEANKVRISIQNSSGREMRKGLIEGKFIVKQTGNVVTCYRIA